MKPFRTSRLILLSILLLLEGCGQVKEQVRQELGTPAAAPAPSDARFVQVLTLDDSKSVGDFSSMGHQAEAAIRGSGCDTLVGYTFANIVENLPLPVSPKDDSKAAESIEEGYVLKQPAQVAGTTLVPVLKKVEELLTTYPQAKLFVCIGTDAHLEDTGIKGGYELLEKQFDTLKKVAKERVVFFFFGVRPDTDQAFVARAIKAAGSFSGQVFVASQTDFASKLLAAKQMLFR